MNQELRVLESLERYGHSSKPLHHHQNVLTCEKLQYIQTHLQSEIIILNRDQSSLRNKLNKKTIEAPEIVEALKER
jgi:hypothetical protein